MKYSKKEIRKADPLPSLCKKTVYNSYEDAREAIGYHQENKWVKDLKAYKCSLCGFWHLTSKNV